MFSPNKLIEAICAPFVALLLIAICIWGTVKLLEMIWLQLLIIVALFGVIAGCILALWIRFRRW